MHKSCSRPARRRVVKITEASEALIGNDPSRLTLGRFLNDVTAAYAGREAVVFDGQRLGYADIRSETIEIARALVGAGVVKGTRVALLMPNRPEWITAAFAVGTIGGVVVPVSTLATPAERAHVLRHSDAAFLLVQPSLLSRDYLDELTDRHPEIGTSVPGRIRCPALPQLRQVFALHGPGRGAIQSWDALRALGRDVPRELIDELADEVEPMDDAFVIYTSGSTALPKGVIHRHRAAVTQFWRFKEQFRLDADERVYSAQPFFWTAGISMTLGCTFASGGTLLLQQVFEPGGALELIESEGATVAFAWAHQSHALAEHPSAKGRDLSSLRKVSSDSPLGRLAGADGNAWGPGASFGLTETFTICSSIPSDSDLDLRSSTHGRTLPGMEIRIVDPESGAVLPDGEPGEIEVRGITLMRGYHKVDTEAVLGSDGYFATNDGGHFDDKGYLHWTGRLGDLIKTGGANVSPGEIERLLDTRADLHTARAVGVAHPTLGEIVVVCAVPAPDANPSEADLRRFLKGHLSAYKLPRRTLFLTEAELNLTANNKIRLEPLRKLALEKLEAEGAEIAGHRYHAHLEDTGRA
ncbi:MAG: AMP-dependent synthetase [Deltaproteobacteria bacterium]|nr:AMP-dependent synthetase [Deltaproteobacteria bacterium]